MRPMGTGVRLCTIGAVTLATVSFHYGFIAPPHGITEGVFHAVHGRLCYIPIILGAVWFGVRGGLATALTVIALTLPYGRYRHITDAALLANEYTEMFFYVAIGLTSGVLIELQRRERKRSERLSRELARKEHLSSLGQMAAGLAHEIKNPLGSIRGAAEVLSDDFPPGSRKHELLKVLAKETARLNRVVEDFLSFAKPRPLDLAPTDLNALLDDVISQMRIETSGYEIVKRYDPSLPPVRLDAEKIRQVFINIVLNAVSAMEKGGRLTIATSRSGYQAEVVFQDTGRGIAPENLERIFDPFFSTRPTGTGLGLSISHTIVQNHGGRIEVESEEGAGTKVTVTLPLDEEKDDESR